MIHKQHIIRALPLIASVLGRQYGVRVSIDGTSACTNGSTIYLPALPVETDNTVLALVRGFLDHGATCC